MIHQPFATGWSSSPNQFVPEIVSPLPCSSELVRHALAFFSPLPAKPKGTLGLCSVRLSVWPSVRQSVRISFPDFFPKCLQILT